MCSKTNRQPVQIGFRLWKTFIVHCGFNDLAALLQRAAGCESIGMSLSLILFAVQILVTIFALVRESGEDERFAGDTLSYRS